MQRRTFLAVTGTVCALSVAGCNDEEAPPDDDADDAEPVDDEEEIDDDVNDDVDDAADDAEPVDDEDDIEENPQLRDVLEWEDSYEMEFEFEDGSGSAVVHEGDVYATWTANGEEIEIYRVDDKAYTVVDGACFLHGMESPGEELVDPEERAEDDETYQATGTTTVEGVEEEVWEFEIDEGTLYVSVDTGYPVRFEGTDDGIVTFHSWGETEPISAPDMECVDPEEDPS